MKNYESHEKLKKLKIKKIKFYHNNKCQQRAYNKKSQEKAFYYN